MRKETFFEAIGQMDEEFLAESLEVTPKKSRRMLWKAVLVAAIVGCLAITAAAENGGGVWGRVEDGHKSGGVMVGTDNGEIYEENNVLKVWVDWSIPYGRTRIMDFYLPELDERVVNLGYGYGGTFDDCGQFSLSWYLEGFSDLEYIELTQFPGNTYNMVRDKLDHVDVIWYVPEGTEYSFKTVLWEDREYFMMEHGVYLLESTGETCTKRVYWANDEYYFRLIYPNWMEDEEVLEMVSNLTVIDSSHIEEWIAAAQERLP